ncbi:unnamed protein product [Mesocestoides corti]|uniref:Uncharacterized protein n=1 Tax=Mesocestoides corti TaxID=53468 RepID=A0A3P6HWE7_MESCO|nr:unnamed protein product [Mesocestoides corti]
MFETAMTLKLNPRRLKKLRNDYLAARSQEQAEQIEVRRLRTENGLLLQRLARLEEDNTYLAKQLVDCNVERAQLSEEVSRLRGSLARLRAAQEASLATPTSSPPSAPAGAENGHHSDAADASAVPPTPQPPPPPLKMTPVANGNQVVMTATPSPRSSDRCGGAGVSETTSGAESWASFSPTSISRSSNDRLLMETIQQLETDLVRLRVRETEYHSALRDAKERNRLLEEKLEAAIRVPAEQMEVLHSELMKVKLREAEGLLKQKELRDRVEEIQTLWDNHQALSGASGGGGGNFTGKSEVGGAQASGFLRTSAGLIHSRLLGRASVVAVTADRAQHLSDRLLETKLFGQISELQQKVSDLNEKVERSALREAALRAELKEAECRCADLEAKRKADAILWRIREIELSSQVAELKQRYSELDCLHDAENAANTLQGPPTGTALSGTSSVAPTPEVGRARCGALRAPRCPEDRLSAMWKDLPPAIMTESIGPLEDLCILPDDPMITSIYTNEENAK